MSEKEFNQNHDSFLPSSKFCKPTSRSLPFKNIYHMLITNFVITVGMPMTYVIIVKLMLTDWNLQMTIK